MMGGFTAYQIFYEIYLYTTGRTSGSTVLVHCEEGFVEISGDTTRTCLPSAEWSGQDLSCLGNRLTSILFIRNISAAEFRCPQQNDHLILLGQAQISPLLGHHGQ